MDAYSSPKTPKSASMEPSNSKSPSKSGHSHATSSSVRILGSQEIAALSPSPPTDQGHQSQDGRPHPEAGSPPVGGEHHTGARSRSHRALPCTQPDTTNNGGPFPSQGRYQAHGNVFRGSRRSGRCTPSGADRLFDVLPVVLPRQS